MKKFFTFLVFLSIIFFPLSASAFMWFGGSIVSSTPCTCSPNVVRITILTARGTISLDYVLFSQKYKSNNTPKALNLLGFYRAGPSCWDYVGKDCQLRLAPFALGTITPFLGSSPH